MEGEKEEREGGGDERKRNERGGRERRGEEREKRRREKKRDVRVNYIVGEGICRGSKRLETIVHNLEGERGRGWCSMHVQVHVHCMYTCV